MESCSSMQYTDFWIYYRDCIICSYLIDYKLFHFSSQQFQTISNSNSVSNYDRRASATMSESSFLNNSRKLIENDQDADDELFIPELGIDIDFIFSVSCLNSRFFHLKIVFFCARKIFATDWQQFSCMNKDSFQCEIS